MIKKMLIVFAMLLAISVSACTGTEVKTSDDFAASEKSTVQSDETNGADNVGYSNDLKTVLDVNLSTAKISFRNSNDNITNLSKEYSSDRTSMYEEYIEKNISEKSIVFLEKEYENIPYYKSRKSEYKNDQNYDSYKDSNTEIQISKDGEIIFFSTQTPIDLFPDESETSIEVAKKYLNLISPGFKYDYVNEYTLSYADAYYYGFGKCVNGISTSESITIRLNSSGDILAYITHDVGMYENVEIIGVVEDECLQKVDEYLKKTYGNILTDYKVGLKGPFYEIYSNDKLELLVPVEVNVKGLQGNDYTITECVVFELN